MAKKMEADLGKTLKPKDPVAGSGIDGAIQSTGDGTGNVTDFPGTGGEGAKEPSWATWEPKGVGKTPSTTPTGLNDLYEAMKKSLETQFPFMFVKDPNVDTKKALLDKTTGKTTTDTVTTDETTGGGGGGTGGSGGGGSGGSGGGGSFSDPKDGGAAGTGDKTGGEGTGGTGGTGGASALPPFELGTIDRDPVYQRLYGQLDELRGIYEQAMQPYTPKTAEQMREQAENEYGSYYDQLRLAAQQSGETRDLALLQQRAGLQSSYDKSREASAKEYARNYSQADRELLRRGMQRSSYAGQTLANIGTQAAEAQQALWDEQVAAETNIDQQRTLLAQQLAQQIAGYNADQARDILSRIQALEDQEYDRSVQAGQQRASLATQLYSLLYQMGRDDITDQQWQLQYQLGGRQQQASEWQWNKQFAETVREFNVSQQKSGGSGGGGGGGSSSGGSGSKTDTTTTPTTPTGGGKNTPVDPLTATFLGMNTGTGNTGGAGVGGKTGPVNIMDLVGGATKGLYGAGAKTGNALSDLAIKLGAKKSIEEILGITKK